MNSLFNITLAALLASFALPAVASAAINATPAAPIQGEPLRITITGTTSVPTSITFDGKKLGVFTYKGVPTALFGIDINRKAGTTTIVATYPNGAQESFDVHVAAREKVTAPLGIPQKLGGNTPAAATTLVSTLAKENASLLGLRTGGHAFWKGPWRHPVADPVVTDTYGYSRDTVGQSITHKGTDYRAPEGTPVLAMNRGVVRKVQEGRNYGKTIIVDHGLGVQTLYMHLSRILVNEGELVLPGQKIGLSGKTGYAEAAHLHLSVRVGEVSIDPEKFLELFK